MHTLMTVVACVAVVAFILFAVPRFGGSGDSRAVDRYRKMLSGRSWYN